MTGFVKFPTRYDAILGAIPGLFVATFLITRRLGIGVVPPVIIASVSSTLAIGAGLFLDPLNPGES